MFAVDEEPVRFDRYVVGDTLGAGGMGVVYRAYDPELGRDVALKVLSVPEERSREVPRLVHEARAMARLSNPHVVGVYHVGAEGEHVFIAMEYVRGRTLEAWLRAESRTRRAVLRAFVQAGRGLSAAHAANVVHGDFKPSNVLVGDEGRVRVTDFGLALLHTHPNEAPGTDEARPVRAGTPGYMAPEQERGRPADERTDQFAFCLALAEALIGSRPEPADLEAALERRSVPAWLRKLLVRGLAREPGQRFDSMDRVLDALERGMSRGRRWGLAGSVGVGIVALGATIVIPADAGPSCEGAAHKLERVWSPEHQARVGAAFRAAGADDADATWRRVDAMLGAYARGWARTFEDTCEAAHAGDERAATTLDARMQCLRAHLTELGALVEVLASADRDVVRHAVEAATKLPLVSRCADVEASQRAPSPPPDAVAADVEHLRKQLLEAKALRNAGRYTAALELALRVLARAQELGYAPLEVEALVRVGNLRQRTGDYAAAETTLTRAVWMATDVRHDELAAAAATELVFVVGVRRAKHAAALGWARHADAMLRRVRAGALEEARLLGNTAAVFRGAQRPEDSIRYNRAALAIRERTLGPDHLSVATSLNNLGSALFDRAELSEARLHHERALAIRERALGAKHPLVASSLDNLGIVTNALGESDRARAHHERALSIRERVLGGHHPLVATTVINLGAVHYRQRRLLAARACYERAQALSERGLGAEHPHLGKVRANLGVVSRELGELEASRAHHEVAITIFERAAGPRSASVAMALQQMAETLLLAGDPNAALGYARRALAIREHTGPALERAHARSVVARALWESRDLPPWPLPDTLWGATAGD